MRKVFILSALIFLFGCNAAAQTEITRPCPSSAQRAKVTIDRRGNIDLAPCPGRSVTVNGGAIGGGGGVSDGDKGDLTISGSGSTYTIDNGVVSLAKLQNFSANVIPARSANSTGVLSEVALGSSNLIGRGSTGNIAPITVSGGLSFSGTVLSSSRTALDIEQVGSLPGTIAKGQIRQLSGNGRTFVATDANVWGEIPTAPSAGSGGGEFIRRTIDNGGFENYSLTHQATVVIDTPTSTENVGLLFNNENIEVLKVSSVLLGGTSPEVTWELCFNTSRSGGCSTITTLFTTNSTTTGNIASSFDAPTINANNWIWIETTGMTGDPDQLMITVIYRKL